MKPDAIDTDNVDTDNGTAREELVAAALRWIEQDPDPETRDTAREVLDGSIEDLRAAFEGRLSFGTAGIRGSLGAGPNHMNRLLCAQTAAGVARVLRAEVPGAPGQGVVLGRDARHGSVAFTHEITRVLTAHGFDVHLIDGPAPTPLVAFALGHLGAAAGIVVTASHNPPTDNGIKVYWADGAQIVAPIDGRIATAIDEVARDGVAPPSGTPFGTVHDVGSVRADTTLVAAYLEAAAGLVHGPVRDPRPLAVSSMHGVGADLLGITLDAFGHTDVREVASQREPDPAFPTVAFPNPEEPGAMDEVVALATEMNADLALANDPDADRVALAAPGRNGTWRTLTGDETGALLGAHLLELTAGLPDRLLATTVVSSRLLGAMAADAGAHFAETLTGFKWLCRPSMEHPEWRQVLTYEEALGYAIGPETRDKDGITAALVAADLACSLARDSRSVWDVLDVLARQFGAHVTSNGSVRLAGPDARERLETIAADLADDPPVALGGFQVTTSDRPADDVLRLWLEDDTRVVLRPSGTEAKFKYYCEAIEPVAGGEHPDDARARARSRLDAVTNDLLELLG